MLDTVIAPVTPEKVTTLKPSEALRLGRLTRPELAVGHFAEGDRAACAAGAIAIGYGWDGREDQHVMGLLRAHGLSDYDKHIVISLSDNEFGDGAVLAYLEERGL